MLFFGKRAAREADETAEEVKRIKRSNEQTIMKAEDSADALHRLLKANGITLRIYIATGGDRRGHH